MSFLLPFREASAEVLTSCDLEYLVLCFLGVLLALAMIRSPSDSEGEP